MVDVAVARLGSEFDGAIPGARRPEERCALSPDVFKRLWPGSRPPSRTFTRAGSRPQIRLTAHTDPDRCALFTVIAIGTGRGRIELGPAAFDRWQDRIAVGVADPLDAVVSRTILDPVRFTEQLTPNTGAALVVIAPHGGLIEEHTDAQAEQVAAAVRGAGRGVASWVCRGQGFDGVGAAVRWHITSTDICERSFPQLRTIMGRRFDRAVAFHGFAGVAGREEVLIGGRGSSALKDAIKLEIETRAPGIAVTLGDPQLGGNSIHNIVNRLATTDCIQIEQSWAARDRHRQAIADAVGAAILR